MNNKATAIRFLHYHYRLAHCLFSKTTKDRGPSGQLSPGAITRTVHCFSSFRTAATVVVSVVPQIGMLISVAGALGLILTVLGILNAANEALKPVSVVRQVLREEVRFFIMIK